MDWHWPERVAVFVAVIAGIGLFVLSMFATAQTGLPDGWLDAFASTYLMLLLKIVLPLWIVLRAFDFVFLAVMRNRTRRYTGP